MIIPGAAIRNFDYHMGRSGNSGSNHAAPIKRNKARAVSAAPQPESVPFPASTVVLLGGDNDTLVILRAPLVEVNAVLQQYFSVAALLADAPPPGPACLVVDLNLEKAGGLPLFQQLKAHGWRLPIVVLVAQVVVRQVVQMMRAGVEDVLVKHGEPAELITAVRRALKQSQQQWAQELRQAELRQRWAELTSRESEIVQLIVAGLLNKQIAEQLDLSIVTVKLYRASAMRKLGARSAAELARLALGAN